MELQQNPKQHPRLAQVSKCLALLAQMLGTITILLCHLFKKMVYFSLGALITLDGLTHNN